MTSKEINAAILSLAFSYAEMNSFIDAIKVARNQMAYKKADMIKPGQRVSLIVHAKCGPVRAVVIEVKMKKAVVRLDEDANPNSGITYIVPLRLLTVI